ncbi:MAG: ion transporter [Gammaproteobacteria bacterium]|nr:ion transporter [Gammaproteobacteria bacterium]
MQAAISECHPQQVSTLLDNASTTARPRGSEPAPSLRRTVFRHLETATDDDLGSRVVDISLVTLIIASVVAVILESMPSFEARFGTELYWFEVFTIAVFSVEYLLRVWSCVETESPGTGRLLQSRLRFMLSFHAMIDLLAILPFYLLAFGVFGNIDMRFLRAVRLMRVLKLTRYFAAMNMLITAVKENGRALAASFLILITIMLMAASGMYYFERQSQPEDFGSIPAAMWWAFATLTTVGYGDVTPITAGGKVFGAMITVVGIGMVALPTSILASGYSQQLKISTKKYKEMATEALDDGVLTDEEMRRLETLRLDIGLGKHTASQILDAGAVRAALHGASKHAVCPHCNEILP